jgi:hypothetical protein
MYVLMARSIPKTPLAVRAIASDAGDRMPARSIA